jgi:hypothetical protein
LTGRDVNGINLMLILFTWVGRRSEKALHERCAAA